jgi:hypothetical protein
MKLSATMKITYRLLKNLGKTKGAKKAPDSSRMGGYGVFLLQGGTAQKTSIPHRLQLVN